MKLESKASDMRKLIKINFQFFTRGSYRSAKLKLSNLSIKGNNYFSMSINKTSYYYVSMILVSIVRLKHELYVYPRKP